jgi:hypothetical protein
MKYSLFTAIVAAFASGVSAADAVKGAAEGFAKGISHNISIYDFNLTLSRCHWWWQRQTCLPLHYCGAHQLPR